MVTGAAATPPAVRRPGARTLTRLRQALVGALAVLVMLASWVVAQAVIAPGNEGFAARLAQAARDDGLGAVVTVVENLRSGVSSSSGGPESDPARPGRMTTVTFPPSPGRAGATSAPTPGELVATAPAGTGPAPGGPGGAVAGAGGPAGP